MNDVSLMRHALALGRRGIGRTGANPSVGCVIVAKDGRVVGRGRTADGGRPHAEVVALGQALGAARGATAFVTLEPCAEVTSTPSCATSLIDAGLARVVVAVQDPDPRTNGAGFAKLRDAGLNVGRGVLETQARESHAGFFKRVVSARPLVTLKIAQSRDGKTASKPEAGRWITGELARRFGHLQRARNDAILVGIDTVLADDPELTCRLPGLELRSPIRVVLDTKLRLSEHMTLARTAKHVQTLVFTTTSKDNKRLRELGVEILRVSSDAQGKPDLDAILQELSRRKITRLLVEGGATIHSAILARGLADRLEVFTSPLYLGDSGNHEIAALRGGMLESFRRVSQRKLGNDILESFERKA